VLVTDVSEELPAPIFSFKAVYSSFGTFQEEWSACILKLEAENSIETRELFIHRKV
jgi:hypothetical protein